MVKKKSVRRKSAKKRISHIAQKTTSDIKIEKALVENFVSLQKVMVNLSVKFDHLANNISKLLELFEISAKALAEKDVNIDQNKKDNREFLQKLDTVLEQNKTIARGMTLMHERMGEGESYREEQSQIPLRMPVMQERPSAMNYKMMQRSAQRPNPNPSPVIKTPSEEEYKKSPFPPTDKLR